MNDEKINQNQNTKIMIYIFFTFLISMTLSGYHVGIEQELYQSIFNCSDDNLSILEEGKLVATVRLPRGDDVLAACGQLKSF